jgi:chromosome segregation ATPase
MKKTAGSEALDSFRALEDRIGRMLSVVGQTRKEKQALAGKLHEARLQIQQLESEIRDLRKERKTVRSRVEDMIREISALERENLKTKKETQVV